MSSRGRGRGSSKAKSDSTPKLVLKAKQGTPSSLNCEWKFYGYIGLFGPGIDKTASTGIDAVPSAHQQNRIKRDGNEFHITLMIKSEMKTALEKLPQCKELKDEADKIRQSKSKISDFDLLLELAAQRILDDWTDLGLGKVCKGDNEAYFKVVQWPSANKFRQQLALPVKDFHITVGFKPADIHDVTKNESTLIGTNAK